MIDKIQEKIKQFVGINFVDSLYKAVTFRDFFIAAFPSCLLRKVRKVRQMQEKKIKALVAACVNKLFMTLWQRRNFYEDEIKK